MGAWGTGSFENDVALDWILNVESVDDIFEPIDRWKQHGKNEIDSDFACAIIAAAESIAYWAGRGMPDFPEELKEYLTGNFLADQPAVDDARNAAIQIAKKSELAELWSEAEADGEKNDWQEQMSRLVDRLNPEIELESIPGHASEFDETDSGCICIFCNESISKSDLRALHIYKGIAKPQITAMVSAHQSCFNEKLHPEFQDDDD